MSERPAPTPSTDSAPFWDALRHGRLHGQRCSHCREVRLYPAAACANCRSTAADGVECEGSGTVHSFTVIHRAPIPAFRAATPYVLARIDLDQGGHLLAAVDVEPKAITIGLPVELTPEPIGEHLNLPRFRPRGEPSTTTEG